MREEKRHSGEALPRGIRLALNRVRSAFMFDQAGGPEGATFLSSGGRTGSTWTSEFINYRRDHRFMFEPISRCRLLVTSKYRALLPGPQDGVARIFPRTNLQDIPPYDNRIQYIRPSDDDPELLAGARSVVFGAFHHPETDQYNYTPRFVFHRRLIKETKSNLWIRWLRRLYPQLKIVLLIRHPVPTVQSRLSDKGDSDPARRQRFYEKLVFGQPDLLTDHLAPFTSVLQGATTAFQQRIAVWCIQNYVPLTQFARDELHVAFYEDFCVRPREALARVFAYTGQPTTDDALDEAMKRIRKPSSTVHYKGTEAERSTRDSIDGMQQVSKWMSRTSDEDLRDAASLLQAFGLDKLYAVDDPLPKADGLTRFMRARDGTPERKG